MKLAKKIFLCIYMPTILGLITISYILIINNYQREKDLIIKISLQEMTTINNSIEKSNIKKIKIIFLKKILILNYINMIY